MAAAILLAVKAGSGLRRIAAYSAGLWPSTFPMIGAASSAHIEDIELAEPFPHPRQRVGSGLEPRNPGAGRVVQDSLDRFERAAERFKVRRRRATQVTLLCSRRQPRQSRGIARDGT